MLAAFDSLSALSIESLPLLSQLLMLAMTIVTFILVYFLVQPWWNRRRQSQRFKETTIPDAITVSGRPLIQASEVAVFNLLHLVSRDCFLVFAKIPLRTLVQVSADDEDARREMVKAIRTLTADFVLVHPGTMLPSKIIMVGSKDHEGAPSNSQHTLMKALCQEAEIDIIQLETQKNYSAREFTELLGLKEDE